MKKYTDLHVLDIVENEGLAYAIFDYMNLDNIENKELRELCKNAEREYRKVEEKINQLRDEFWEGYED